MKITPYCTRCRERRPRRAARERTAKTKGARKTVRPWVRIKLSSVPLYAVGNIGYLDAHGLQLVADAVGFGEILGLLSVAAGKAECLDLGILLAGLGNYGEGSGGCGLGLCVGLALYGCHLK